MAEVPPARHPHRDAVLLVTRATFLVLLLVGLGIVAGVFLGGLLVHLFSVLHLGHVVPAAAEGRQTG